MASFVFVRRPLAASAFARLTALAALASLGAGRPEAAAAM